MFLLLPCGLLFIFELLGACELSDLAIILSSFCFVFCDVKILSSILAILFSGIIFIFCDLSLTNAASDLSTLCFTSGLSISLLAGAFLALLGNW